VKYRFILEKIWDHVENWIISFWPYILWYAYILLILEPWMCRKNWYVFPKWILGTDQEYFTYMETSPLLGKGCKIYADAWGLRASKQGGIFIVPHLLWHSPAEFGGKPSNVVYSFVLGTKWKLRMSRSRICMMPPWHPWAFCTIQDGVQDGRQFKQTSRTPPLFNVERWFWCQTLCF
jgi:hypothetical protein